MSFSTEILGAKQPPAASPSLSLNSNHTVSASASRQVTGFEREVAFIISFHSSY